MHVGMRKGVVHEKEVEVGARRVNDIPAHELVFSPLAT